MFGPINRPLCPKLYPFRATVFVDAIRKNLMPCAAARFPIIKLMTLTAACTCLRFRLACALACAACTCLHFRLGHASLDFRVSAIFCHAWASCGVSFSETLANVRAGRAIAKIHKKDGLHN